MITHCKHLYVNQSFLCVSVVLDSVWKRFDPQERDFWEDGRPADHPVCLCGQRRADVLWSSERRRLRVERNHADQDCAGCTRGIYTAYIYTYIDTNIIIRS